MRTHLGCWLVVFAHALQMVAAEGPPPITNCLQVLQLSPDAVKEARPVHLRGSVTCYVPASQLCFVQDETAGVYVLPSAWNREFTFGEVVELDGVTGSGRFSPVVQGATISSTGERAAPVAIPISIEELNSGRFDSQFVQINGVVQSAETRGPVEMLHLFSGDASATVLAFGLTESSANLVNSTIHVEGVGGTFYDEQRLAGFGLFAQGSEHVRTTRVAREGSDPPLRNIRAIASYSKDSGLDQRVRVRGVVTVAWPGESFLQDDTGVLRVEAPRNAKGGTEEVRSGDWVEASGFVRDALQVPRLAEAVVRKVGTRNVPDAPFRTIKELFSNRPTGQYVSTEGLLMAAPSTEGEVTFIEVATDGRSLTALCRREKIADLRPGSRLRLTGAWAFPPSQLRNGIGPVLWLNSPAAVTLLAPPKAIVSQGLTPSSRLWIATTFGALLLAAAVAARGRQARLQSVGKDAASTQRLTDLEREIQRLDDARERLGRDLHDRIIQSIYAIGLNIDNCAQSTQANPAEVQGNLRSALKDVNAVIGELRNVILGLETNAIQPRELRTALKSLALALGHQEGNRIRVDIDDEALAALTPAQATELVHIAREAMSNSVRHGAATTTTFRIELREERIRFGIEDDGCGFDLKSAEGRGFGLRNMAKRAQDLGAKFSIESEEGRGTRVMLDIPRQKQHFSSHDTRTRIDRG